MSTIRKNLIKATYSLLLLTIMVMGFFIWTGYNDIQSLKRENEYLHSLTEEDENLVTIILEYDGVFYTYHAVEGAYVYDVLLVEGYEFSTWDGVNYYFVDRTTEVKGLSEEYYDEWGYLQIGLQAIEATDNLVIRAYAWTA